MQKQKLDAYWKKWLQENLDRRCDPKELASVLLNNKFALRAIRAAMGDAFPVDHAFVSTNTPPPLPPQHKAIAATRLTRTKNPQLTKIDTELLQLYTFDDFLSHRECDDLVDIINQHLRPSTLTTAELDKSYRTSRTCDLSLLKNPFVAAIDARIARTVGIRLPYVEGNQAQRYDVGQQFKEHTDYFAPGTAEYAEYASSRGNRTWTFMVYLNEGMVGGGTKFFSLDKVFTPKKGQAVIWNSLHDDGSPNPHTLHSGEPVLEGHKIIITQWFREKGAGKMFY